MARKRNRPEEEALLAAVIEAPEDDAPRLVYADWLDENGQTEADRARAEYIRGQIRLHREEDGERTEERPERLDALRREHRKAWEQGLPAWTAGRCAYRRGFLERVSATAAQFLQDGPRLRQLVPLRELFLERVKGRLGPVASGGLLRGLRLFAVSREPLGPEDARALAECGDLAGVVQFRLNRCSLGPGGVELLAGAAWLAGVEELDLAQNDFATKGALSLARVPFRRLRDLNLVANALRAEALTALLASANLASSLLAFNLAYNDLGPGGARALGGCTSLSGLRRLNLCETNLGDEGAGALAASPHLAGLTSLNLREARITDAGAAALAASPHLAGLTELYLGENPIVSEGIRALLDSPHLTKLTTLDVASTRRRRNQDQAALQAVRERFGAC